METVQQHLQEGSVVLTDRVESFYTSIMDVNPAIFLHPNLSETIPLDRLARVIRHHDPSLIDAGLFEQLRAGIWGTATQDPDTWFAQFPSALWHTEVDSKQKRGPLKLSLGKTEKWERILPRLPEAFTQVE